MKTLNIKKVLFSLTLCALFALSPIKAEDTAPATDTAATTDTTATDAALENTLPITLEQFDKLRALIQRQSDNAAQLDRDFQGFLDDLLGTSTADATTDTK